jgi:sporulation protein YabP
MAGVAEEKHAVQRPHQVILQDRRTLTVSGVTDVDSFDETTVVVYTDMGELTVHGAGLQIQRLNVETGELTVEGEVESLVYTAVPTRSGGLFGRLFR